MLPPKQTTSINECSQLLGGGLCLAKGESVSSRSPIETENIFFCESSGLISLFEATTEQYHFKSRVAQQSSLAVPEKGAKRPA